MAPGPVRGIWRSETGTGVNGSGPAVPESGQPTDRDLLNFVRAEIRFELDLLHGRVNALLAGEAFLTIAYTAAMSNATAWGPRFAAVCAPLLASLGLALALLVTPGVAATARIVLTQTALQMELVERLSGSTLTGYYEVADRPSALVDQRRSLLFFRAVPVMFAVVWIILLILVPVLVR